MKESVGRLSLDRQDAKLCERARLGLDWVHVVRDAVLRCTCGARFWRAIRCWGCAQELSCTGSVVMPARVMPGCCVLWLLCCSTLWFQRHNPVRDATRDAAIPLWGFDADRGPRLVSPATWICSGKVARIASASDSRGAGVWTRSSAILTGRVCAVRWWRPSFVWARGHGSQAGLEFRSGTPLPSGSDEVSRETTADG